MANDSIKKYIILTYGCQMNERDSETIAGMLEQNGYSEALSLEGADLIVVNTCSVRHSAENKVYGKLGQLKVLKTKHPNMRVALGGCMAQLPEVRTRLKKLGVDIVFGTHNIHELPEMLQESQGSKKPYVRVWEQAGQVVEDLPNKRIANSTAFVNIMYGCNNFCSYCIVPYVRGRERSRHPMKILDEIKLLVDNGVREVTLLGQNVNSYGRGLSDPIDFADLLVEVNKIDRLFRIRFMTSHPRDFNAKLTDTVAGLDRVCEHIHIPIQSGSDRILRAMNRGYTREDYLALTGNIRQRIPEVAITSDFIVGFPGEDEEDFAQTLDLVQRVEFDAAFTFIYSPRSGTQASTLDNQLPRTIKTDRLIRLNEELYGMALSKNRQLEKQTVEVLVEGPSKTNDKYLTGRTRTNRLVMFEGPESLIGELVMVRIIEAKTFNLWGEVNTGKTN